MAVWHAPSPPVAELIRRGCRLLLEQPDAVFEAVDAAVFETGASGILADPAFVEATRRTNRANLQHWVEHTLADPGAPVPPNLGPETLGIARDLVRRGLDAGALDAYRTGQNTAWRMWMAMAFTLTTDPAELAELLDVSARSIFSFVDETLAGITAQVEREREALLRGTQAERLEVVTLVLQGAPIDPERASTRLGYALGRAHTAAVCFSDDPRPDPGELERAGQALGAAAGGRRVLTVLASAASLWAWVAGDEAPAPAAVEAALETLPGVRVALGPAGVGVEGFRRSHQDALATQRLLVRGARRVRVAAYDDVAMVALVTQDEERAAELVARTLGDLATAPGELRETLRTYLREGSNASRTAEVLFTHRNTVLNRLARAERLLPAPLAGRGLQVALALEVVRWTDPRA
jgi:DNA-binding PucR family transcriptional regulator